jgi:precorrin-3B C17-methyltransferase
MEKQTIAITSLEKMPQHSEILGMITTVIVGNASTFDYIDGLTDVQL